MNKNLCLIIIFVILVITFLSGCQEEGTNTDNNPQNVLLDSDLVELVYFSLNFNKDDQGIVLGVEVQYRFRNIGNRDIDINVFAEFYDKENNLLAKEGPKEIYIPEGWTEQGISPANIISYNGENASSVEYVKIIVEEKV